MIDIKNGARVSKKLSKKSAGGKEIARKSWILAIIILLAFMILPQFFGRYHYLIELFTHFQLQYILSATLLILLGFILRFNIFYILSFFLLVVSHALIFLYPLTIRAQNSENFWGTDIFYINMNYFNEDINPIKSQIHYSKADVVAIVEINPIMLNYLNETYGDPISISGAGSQTCAIFSKIGGQELKLSEESFEYDVCKAEIAGRSIILIHPYPPLSEEFFRRQSLHFREIAKEVEGLDERGEDFLLLGDFNSTYFAPTFRESFSQYFKVNNYSWEVGKLQMLPIDHAMSNTSIKVLPGEKSSSDHSPLLIRYD